MDTFMDKLTQRRNAQEMIQANTAADTAKMELLQRQMDEYDKLLQDMRKINLKTAENMELMQKTAQESIRKIQAIQESDDVQVKRDGMLEEIKKQMEGLSAAMAKQMQEVEELSPRMTAQLETLSLETKKQTEGLLEETKKQLETFSAESKKQLEEAFAKSDDFLHKENVKVYRNVQAAMTEELNKQTDLIVGKQQEHAGKQKALVPLSVITMLLVLVDVLLRLFNIVIPI